MICMNVSFLQLVPFPYYTDSKAENAHVCTTHLCSLISPFLSLFVFLLLSSSFALFIYTSCCLYIYHIIDIFVIYYDHTVPLHSGNRSTGSSMRWKPGSKFVNLLSPEATSYMTRGFHQITCIMSWKYIQMWYVPNIWPWTYIGGWRTRDSVSNQNEVILCTLSLFETSNTSPALFCSDDMA